MSKLDIIQDVDIKLLKPYPKNCFDHSVNINDIANSIRDFGYNKVSIGIDEDNVLLYGHGTLLALKMLGYKIVPMVCKISGLTEDQKQCYRVADNTAGLNSRIIQDLVKEELSHQLTFDFANYGMPLEYLFDMQNLDSSKDSCGKTADEFAKQNPAYTRPEKMWMYIEFQTKEDWDAAVAIFGKNKSRRILDTDKIMEIVNDKMPK